VSAFAFHKFDLAAGGHTFDVTLEVNTTTAIVTIDQAKLLVMEF
jgi:hypothetical protein